LADLGRRLIGEGNDDEGTALAVLKTAFADFGRKKVGLCIVAFVSDGAGSFLASELASVGGSVKGTVAFFGVNTTASV
jgi:hypothetical protein